MGQVHLLGRRGATERIARMAMACLVQAGQRPNYDQLTELLHQTAQLSA